MSEQQTADQVATIEIQKIGGIDEATAEFSPGVTLLTGQNATNRTSFLQAIMAVAGSENATLKADADEGSVRLTLDDETYSRTLTRRGDTIGLDGNPYLDDPTLADLFAFLLESNECRQAVAGGADLHELIMRPVDTDAIEREIANLDSEKGDIDANLETLDELERKLPDLEDEKRRLEDEIEEKRGKLGAKKEELAEFDKEIGETDDEKRKLEAKLEELNSVRGELERVRAQIESEHESIEALEAEQSGLESELETHSPVSDDRITDLDQKAQRLRGQIDAIDQTVTELQSIIQFNETVLDDGYPDLVDQLEGDGTETDGGVTSELLADSDTVTCWTCGSVVETDQIDSTVDDLRSLREQKTRNRRSLEERVDELHSERTDLERTKQRYEDLQRELDDVDREIADRRETIETSKERKEELEVELTELEAEVEELQAEDHSDILAVNEAVNKLEFELDQHDSELSRVETEIERIEDRLAERTDLESRRETVETELGELRRRVEDLQTEAIEAFNDHMEVVLDLLEYENLERIWIERTHETVREGRRNVERARFDLHVVRSTASGTVYSDTVDHLSESEREVVGLVFALAGYLVHEVYDHVPFMLLDSVEALDAGRVSTLVDYLEGHADYLVVALLEEDAAALDDTYQRITAI